ncbi:hypothetical protein KPATCC21470_2467 [Kitasatospora purpeofusca]
MAAVPHRTSVRYGGHRGVKGLSGPAPRPRVRLRQAVRSAQDGHGTTAPQHGAPRHGAPRHGARGAPAPERHRPVRGPVLSARTTAPIQSSEEHV